VNRAAAGADSAATGATGRAALPVLLLLACALVASLLAWISTRWGVGTSPDSVQYLLGARSLLSGSAVVDLPRQWPPLYPVVLAIAGAACGDLLLGARVLHALLFGLNVLLFGLLLWERRGTAWVPVVAGALAFCLSPVLYLLHHMAWSESLFLGLLLAHWLFLARGADRSRAALALAGVLLGLALLTRYAGIAFVIASALWLACQPPAGRRGIAAAAILLATALALPAAWAAWLAFAATPAAPRVLALHPIGTEHLRQAVDTVLAWGSARTWGALPGAVLVCAATLAIAAGARGAARPARLARMLLLGALTYVAFLVVSISLFDHYTPLDVRILAPAQVLLLGALAASAGARGAQRRGAAALTTLLLVLLALGGTPELRAQVQANTRYGSGYLDPRVAQLPALGLVRALDPAVRVVSNAPELVQLHVGLEAAMLPVIHDRVRDAPNPSFGAEFGTLVQDVAAGRAIVVVFAAFAWRDYLPGEAALQGAGLPVAYREADATVFGSTARREPR
jgi:4-amino-4-deoxy-L-arabinose transferase-like glycosyltransferase